MQLTIMGAFSDIFGDVPKVLVLEMFAENPNDELSVRDIIDQTKVSKRGVYLIVRKFKKSGLLIELPVKPRKYMLNFNDLRVRTLVKAEPLLIMGKLEYELKMDNNIYPSEIFKLNGEYSYGYLPERELMSQETNRTDELENDSKIALLIRDQTPVPSGA